MCERRGGWRIELKKECKGMEGKQSVREDFQGKKRVEGREESMKVIKQREVRKRKREDTRKQHRK